MIPLALVTGFLGSGKTSFLRHILETHRAHRLLYIVNEFAPRDVDGAMLAREGAEVLTLPGGSLFCRCKVTEFIAQLRAVAARAVPQASCRQPGPARRRRYVAPASCLPPIEGVVIETSGIADPRVAEQMLAETGLSKDYALASIFCVVDPLRFLKLIQVLPNLRAQVEAADVVLLNKTDLCDAALIAQTEAALRELKPGLAIVRTVHGRADVDLFGASRPRGLTGEYAPCRDPHYATFSIPIEREVDLAELRNAVEGAGPAIYRLKGFVRAGGALFHVDYSTSGLTIEKAPPRPDAAAPGLALIAPAAHADAARAMADSIRLLAALRRA